MGVPWLRGEAARAFERTARQVMTAPVRTCTERETVETAAQAMARDRISSLVVVDQAGRAIGLVTDHDLVVQVLAAGRPGSTPVAAAMQPLPAVLEPESPLDVALLLMVRHGLKHLAVAGDGGRPVGIVTVRDLLKARTAGAFTVVRELEAQTTVEGLVQAYRHVDHVLLALVHEGAAPEHIGRLMGEFNDRLTARAVALAVEELRAFGLGDPPVRFCWLTMGSGGRHEQVARTDQDNALVWETLAGDEAAGTGVDRGSAGAAERTAGYFARLGARVVEILVACGFKRCPGDVMASNPVWRHPLDEWTDVVNEWIYHPTPENVRFASIFFDFRGVAGDLSLADRLRAYIFQRVRQSPVFLRHLALDDARSGTALGLFGTIAPERSGPYKGTIDLKRRAMVHIVDAMRILALKHGIGETGTLERMRRLVEARALAQEDADFYAEAYSVLWDLRIRLNLRQQQAGAEVHSHLPVAALSRLERHHLREALRQVARVQGMLAHAFQTEGL